MNWVVMEFKGEFVLVDAAHQTRAEHHGLKFVAHGSLVHNNVKARLRQWDPSVYEY